LAIDGKGGEFIGPKQKDSTTIFPFSISKISIGIYFKSGIYFSYKTLLIAKGRISSGGALYLVKGKAFQIGGDFFKIFKVLFEIIFCEHKVDLFLVVWVDDE
jgi:hypothetical protein